MRRPELVCSRRLNSSETSVSSGPSSSSSALFRFLLLAECPRLPAALSPALPPLGLPPRYTVLLPLGLPPRLTWAPALLPLGLPPLLLPLVGVSVLTPAAAAISAVIESSPSILTLGLLPTLPLRPPVLTPPLVTFVVGVAVPPRSWLVTIWLSTDSRAASHSAVF